MYTAIRRYESDLGLIDGIIANSDEIRRLLQEIDGFVAYYVARTGESGATSISIYEDRAGAEASTAAAREWIVANLPDLAAMGPPEVAQGEVAWSC